jgi:hypothetical protein
MEAAERALYPELERQFQNPHSMTPMRAEHAEIRRRIGEMGRLRRDLEAGRVPTREAVALRRVLFSLYAMLKVHLAEEELYLGIVTKGAGAGAADAMAAALEHPIAPPRR